MVACHLGKQVEPGEFWDLVVLTAVDDNQREAYELQISEKLERKEIPLGIPYHVFSDPPGAKIGEDNLYYCSVSDFMIPILSVSE